MTREEAKRWLTAMKLSKYLVLPSEAEEAVDMAIEALSADAVRLIDANALIFELEEWKKNPNNDDSAVDLVNHFIGIIRATPSAEPKIVGVKFSPFTIEDTSTPSQTSVRGTQEVKIIEMPSAEPRKCGTCEWYKACEVFDPHNGTCRRTEPSLKAIKKQIDEHWYLDKNGDLISRDDVFGCIEDAQDGSVETYNILSQVFNDVLALPSADRPTVVRCKVAFSKEDFNKWEKRLREKNKNKNIIVLPYEAECVNADRPQGEWIDWLGCGNEWECSICKCSIESHGSIAYNYCPMCGARMESK